MREKISACITAGNEEKNIRRCLESVAWCDEIIVVDSFSKDRTADICREYTDLVYEHRWLGYIGQKNLIKDLASHPWILFIDADEEVSVGLRDEIIREFDDGACRDFAGYQFPRMVKFLGRWITHGDWYPDIKLRLFRKELGRCGGKEPHDRTTVEGPVRLLQHHLYHHTYANIADQIQTINNFSSISARGHVEDGRRFRVIDLMLRPVYRSFRSYILKLGFLDGLPGFIIAVAVGFGVFLKYAKLWEAHYGSAPEE
jgi:glycosyltransferase involved in cell wall biosynthesis